MGEAQASPPSKGVPERQRGRGMLVRLLDQLFGNPINIPLRRFAFATHRCPPSKGDVGLAKAIGAGVVFRPHRHPPAALRLRCTPRSPFEGARVDVSALPDYFVKDHQRPPH